MDVVHERHSIVDVGVPGSPQEMADILDAIDDALDEEGTVYLHCWGGVGRTGTVVGCWLVRHGRTGDQALRQLAEWWQGVAKVRRKPQSPETPEQFRYVREWTEPSPEESPMSEITTLDRFRGCLLGLAAGDALGTTLEFQPPGTFEAIDDMVGGGPFGLEPGQWTDDTSMALCLATSLIEREGFDPTDQMERYVRWWREGYLSSNGRCFDIGNTVRDALSRFERDGDPYAGSSDPDSAGNGSLMRLAPVPMFCSGDPAEAISRAADSSRTTHQTRAAVDACRYFAGLLVGALDEVDKETLLSAGYCPVEGLWEQRSTGGGDRSHRQWLLQGSKPPRDRWHRLCRPVARGGALGLPPHRHLPRRRPARGEPRRRRRYDRRDLRPDRRRVLRGRRHPGRVARAAHDGRRDHVDGGRPVLPRHRSPRLRGGAERASGGNRHRRVDEDRRRAGPLGQRAREGHTVEQVLSYDVAEAEAAFGRPFDDEMDSEMRFAMYQADRIWLGETMGKVASATSYVLDGKCIRTAKIEHCNEIRGCVPGAAPISHLELTSP